MTQKVLVTAGAGGIGLAISKRFASAGVHVHVLDIDAAALRDACAIDGISGTVADISNAKSAAEVVNIAVEQLGGLDVLVNNAGIAGGTAPVSDYPLETWRRVMDVNLTGTFAVTAAAIPHLARSEQASILIMSSLAGRFGYPNRSAYSVSKWGLVGFAKTLSLELGSMGITCNAILPGAVAGDRIKSVLQGRAEMAATSIEDERQNALRNQAIQRFVPPEEIAELAWFLAGPAGRSISGQIFPIDGDSRSAA